ncbi:hypothetical protein [Microbaculum marinum]|uniref:Uncharacterized protein n=1 Tax=Microbaculum marinum TaxID=1764581 RepID=A0AAW9RNP2_9HYPH
MDHVPLRQQILLFGLGELSLCQFDIREEPLMLGKPYLLLAVTALLLSPASAFADKIGPTFPVNTTSKGWQASPGISSAPNGRFLSVWQFKDRKVFAQRFNKKGMKIGGEFRVGGSRRYAFSPAIAYLDDGRFVIVWISKSGQNADRYRVFGQLFDGRGQPLGSQFKINDGFSDFVESLTAVALPNGRFVVGWIGRDTDRKGNHWHTAYGQLFTRSGSKRGDPFPAYGPTKDRHAFDVAAFGRRSKFVFVYTNEEKYSFGQIYNRDGSRFGGEFPLDLRCYSYDISVSSFGADNFIFGCGTRIRIFDSEGSPIGPARTVDSMELPIGSPAIAPTPDGGAVLTWTEIEEYSQNRTFVRAVRVDDAGEPIGDYIPVEDRRSRRSDVVGLSDGRYVIVWENQKPNEILGAMFE